VPGNDDSVLCLNYYCFLISRSVIYSKVLTLREFKYKIRRKRKYFSMKELNLKRKALLSFIYSNDFFLDYDFKLKVLNNKINKVSRFLNLG